MENLCGRTKTNKQTKKSNDKKNKNKKEKETNTTEKLQITFLMLLCI